MHIVLMILSLAGAAFFWMYRIRAAKEMAGELVDMVGDVRAAARRFGFNRRKNIHPVDSIETPELAIGGVAVAFFNLDGLTTQETVDALEKSIADTLVLGPEGAQEVVVLGRWFASECGTPNAAITRMARKLHKLGHPDSLTQLMQVLNGTMTATDSPLSQRQSEALDDIKQAFHIR